MKPLSGLSWVLRWRQLPTLSLGLLLSVSWLAGMALGPMDLDERGWIVPFLDLPTMPAIMFLLGCLGFIWGALAPQCRSPLTQPLSLAVATYGITLGVGILGGLVHSVLTLTVFAVGSLVTEVMGAQMQDNTLSLIPAQMQEIVVFCTEIGLWLGALLMLTGLSGTILQRLRTQHIPYSQAILAVLLTVGTGLSLGWHVSSWTSPLSILLLATSVSLPLWIFEQADRRGWGRGIAALISVPVAVTGIGVGWSLHLGLTQVLPGITFVFAVLLVVAPAVIVFELSWQRGVRGGMVLALSTMALLIPAAGLGLGVLYHGHGLILLDPLF